MLIKGKVRRAQTWVKTTSSDKHCINNIYFIHTVEKQPQICKHNGSNIYNARINYYYKLYPSYVLMKLPSLFIKHVLRQQISEHSCQNYSRNIEKYGEFNGIEKTFSLQG